MIDFSKYTNQKDLFKFLKENKERLIAQKRFEMKKADAVSFQVTAFHPENKEEAMKAAENTELLLSKDIIKVRSVINTTNLMDSHYDVHIPGLWKKSLKEQRNLYLLQEHQMKFDHIISDNVTASAKKISWKELGLEFEGQTEALLFDSEIEKARNSFMFDQYARGYVKNHSIGMRYVQLFMCINSEEKYYIEEKENWDKYIGEVVNGDVAEAEGFFWAVTEAKIVEGSAVPLGSNYATPTQSVKEYFEPPQGTQPDGPSTTPTKNMFSKFNQLLK